MIKMYASLALSAMLFLLSDMVSGYSQPKVSALLEQVRASSYVSATETISSKIIFINL